MLNNVEIANNIKKIRIKQGKSQKDLGDAIGYTDSLISKYEKEGFDSLKTIRKICKYLCVSEEAVMFGESSNNIKYKNENNIRYFDNKDFEIIEENIRDYTAESNINKTIEQGKHIICYRDNDTLLRKMGNNLKNNGYKIKLLNFQNIKYSNNYEPLLYLKNDIDVKEFSDYLVLNILKGTKKEANIIQHAINEELNKPQNNYGPNFINAFKKAKLSHNELEFYDLYGTIFGCKSVSHMLKDGENEVKINDFSEKTIIYINKPKNKTLNLIYEIFNFQLINIINDIKKDNIEIENEFVLEDIFNTIINSEKYSNNRNKFITDKLNAKELKMQLFTKLRNSKTNLEKIETVKEIITNNFIDMIECTFSTDEWFEINHFCIIVGNIKDIFPELKSFEIKEGGSDNE